MTGRRAGRKITPRPRSNLAGRRLTQKVAFALLWLTGLAAIVALLAVVGYVALQGAQVLNLEFLLTPPRGGLSGEGGISTTVVTTFYLALLTIAIAAPLGVGAAVYLVEYADEIQGRVIRLLVGLARFGVETLAGVPSIIFGLFGYALFVAAMHFGFSLLSAGLAGACLILPLIIRATEEALRTVPRSYREGSLALGTTKWQTVWGVVLPAALPGIITSIVLSVGRVASETAVFYVTLGGSYRMPTSLLSGGRTMALHVYYLAMETRAFDKAMGTGAILILSIILINAIINYLSRRLTVKE
ncbi:MAG: phosphate ABC transporter, permease protein PstA [Anaerolineaceae bacterium 4572_32.1]|nr:MAG: phosphate ABC transporter, permease protein PstA [Anaerolineaceae bacterium 4572_32.1]